MILRVARHTNNLEALVKFYTEVIGLEILGKFNNHEDYDGVFLGKPNRNWHLEFTTSNQTAKHQPDADDLLVFYPESRVEYDLLMSNIAKCQIRPITAQNPYWNQNGISILDPDGFGIIISDSRINS